VFGVANWRQSAHPSVLDVKMPSFIVDCSSSIAFVTEPYSEANRSIHDAQCVVRSLVKGTSSHGWRGCSQN
jgi:hypothetical protein